MWRLVKINLVPISLRETFRGLGASIGNANHLRIFENLPYSCEGQNLIGRKIEFTTTGMKPWMYRKNLLFNV